MARQKVSQFCNTIMGTPEVWKLAMEDQRQIAKSVQETLAWLKQNALAEKDEFEATHRELEGFINLIMETADQVVVPPPLPGSSRIWLVVGGGAELQPDIMMKLDSTVFVGGVVNLASSEASSSEAQVVNFKSEASSSSEVQCAAASAALATHPLEMISEEPTDLLQDEVTGGSGEKLDWSTIPLLTCSGDGDKLGGLVRTTMMSRCRWRCQHRRLQR